MAWAALAAWEAAWAAEAAWDAAWEADWAAVAAWEADPTRANLMARLAALLARLAAVPATLALALATRLALVWRGDFLETRLADERLAEVRRVRRPGIYIYM
jgi:hypothetical protein